MSAPLHIGLILQGGSVWAGGLEYIRNLQLALRATSAADPSAPIRVTVISGNAPEEGLRERFGPAEWLELPLRGGKVARLLRLNARRLSAEADRLGVDVLFPLTYDNDWTLGLRFPLPARFGRARWAGWIPDFQHRHLPQFFSPAEVARRDRAIGELGRDATRIVFSSESVARDFTAFFPSARARAVVLRFSTAPIPEWYAGDPDAVRQRYHLPERFFMICNQFWSHKDHATAFRALAELRARGLTVHVVCTGQTVDLRDNRHFNHLLGMLHLSGIAPQVSLLGLIPRADQIQLMRRAQGVIQPSLAEGWSTVVEDARLLGKALLLSDLEVHREQAPPHARFFTRGSSEELAALLAEAAEQWPPGPDAAAEALARAAAEERLVAYGRQFAEFARSLSPQP